MTMRNLAMIPILILKIMINCMKQVMTLLWMAIIICLMNPIS